ncbi:MAG: response regulator [Armatimonadetes bacterium]|nr:response regulator [Armatimonadota bacterium]
METDRADLETRVTVILLVEDEPGDAYLTKEAVQGADAALRVDVVEDGVEALAYLHRLGCYQDAPRPALVILDLNLPRKDGREVLAEMKGDPDLASIPVVVMTTSSAQRDIAQAYALHANCYVTKPVELDQYMQAVRATCEFWLSTARLPVGEDEA